MALLLPAAARADATVDFEGFAPGTTITNQYKDQGGTNRGPIFGTHPTGSDGNPPEIEQVAAGEAQSGNRVADICLSCNKEFATTHTWARFPITKEFVRVFVGIAAGSSPVTLEAFDAAGNPIAGAVQTKTVTAGAGYHTMLEVGSAAKNIGFVQIRPPSISAHAPIKIDDLTYDTPAVPPPADFALAVDPNQFFGAIGLNPGKTASVSVKVNRVNGSSGPLDFKATGLPAGVSASFAPQPGAADPASALLTLTAAASVASFDGSFTVTATPAGGGSSPGSAPRSIDLPLDIRQNFDVQVNGIEVSQGVQSSSLPARDPSKPTQPVAYSGAKLAAGGRTVVRVFANVANPTGGSVKDVEAVLYGARNDGGALPGSPIAASGGRVDLAYGAASVSTADRAGRTAFEFVLPYSWTKGTIKLEARIFPPEKLFGPSEAECEKPACAQNNSFALNGIAFTDTPEISIAPVRLTVDGWNPAPPSYVTFERARNLAPLGDGELHIPGYFTDIDVTDIAKATYRSYFGPWFEDLGVDPSFLPDDPLPGSTITALTHDRLRSLGRFYPGDLLMGVNPGGIRGQSNGGINPGIARRSAIVRYWDGVNSKGTRPLSSVAHEMFHAFGRPHAGTDSSCYTDPKDLGVSWPPDEKGFIQSVGLDRATGSGAGLSLFRPLVPRADSGVGSTDATKPDFQPEQWIDLMSYCAAVGGGDPDSWISQRHWDETIDYLVAYGALRGARRRIVPAAATGVLDVQAVVTPGAGVQLMRVAPQQGSTQAAQESPYHMVLRGSSGQVLSDTPMAVSSDHIEDGGSVTVLGAAVPVPGGSLRKAQSGGVAALDITSGGAVVATRRRTPSVPRVKVGAPRAGARVGSGKAVGVSWTTTDPDGVKGMTASVDYSADDGKSWRTVWTGADEGKASIPSAALPASKRARVRVRANDGFNEGSGRSRRFEAAGRRPTALITSPPAGTTLPADATLNLTGQAYDDAGRPLAGSRVRWLDGRRSLGSGDAVAASGLRPGTHTISLVATDRLRRSSTARVKVKVTAVAPQFLSVSAPARLDPGASKLKLRVASTLPATLTVSGQGVKKARVAVTRKRRSVTVRVTPGATDLNVGLTLKTGKLATRLVAFVPRS